MSSIILKDLLKHKIRKQILKKNKKLNHKAFVKSMNLGQKIPFLMKYHKKKLIVLLLFGIISWTYQLGQTYLYWIRSIKSPHLLLLGMIVDMQKPQSTVQQLESIIKISLHQQTQNILMKLFYEADKYLYFGVSRKYLFHVYQELGLLQTQQDQRIYWQRSEFHKKRNQLAAGISFVEHLQYFQQALKKKRKIDSSITQQQFLHDFINKFIQKAPQIWQWQKQFNLSRQKQFLKNAPGLIEIKKQTISNILIESINISQDQLQNRLKSMGLKGLNVSQKYFYNRSKQVWYSMKQMNLIKRLSHPTIHMNIDEKNKLQKQLQKNRLQLNQIRKINQENIEQYRKLYDKQLL